MIFETLGSAITAGGIFAVVVVLIAIYIEVLNIKDKIK